MNYPVFESIISPVRMQRYLIASGHDTRQAMVLYRLNLHLSQELFTLICCFEIALGNAIDDHYTRQCGADWLRDAIAANRIAHHEPVCFASGQSTCCIHYAQQHYRLITDLFQWLNIRPAAFLYGLDHVPGLLHRLHHFGPSTKSPDITARATF